MSTKVFVDGQEGTTGLKIFEYLSRRTDVEVLRIEESKRKDLDERRKLINASDVTFLCLPDVASRESAGLVQNEKTVIIDARRHFVPMRIGHTACRSSHVRSANACVRPSALRCPAAMHPHSCWPCARSSMRASSRLISRRIAIPYGLQRRRQKDDRRLRRRIQSEAAKPTSYALALGHKHLPEMAFHTGLKAARSSRRSSARSTKASRLRRTSRPISWPSEWGRAMFKHCSPNITAAKHSCAWRRSMRKRISTRASSTRKRTTTRIASTCSSSATRNASLRRAPR